MSANRTVVITGGTSGLGKETMNTFIENGWNVGVCGRRKGIIDHIQSNEYSHLIAEVCDIRIESTVTLFLRKVVASFGKIDVVILNAATLGPVPLPPVKELSIEDLRMTFETNFFGNFNFLKSALPSMKDNGLIIHITSDAATTPYPGWGAYSSSKAAFDMLIKILNIETSQTGIEAFSYDPGDMDTEMHHMAIPEDTSPLKDPREVAAELFLDITKKVGEENA